MKRTRRLKDGRLVKLLEHSNYGTGWHVSEVDGNPIPFFVEEHEFKED